MVLLRALHTSSAGYHGNKLSYMWSLAKLGFSFYVHPEVMVLHLPHPPQNELHEVETVKLRTVCSPMVHACDALTPPPSCAMCGM